MSGPEKVASPNAAPPAVYCACTSSPLFNQKALAIGFFVVSLILGIAAVYFASKHIYATIAFGSMGGIAAFYSFYLVCSLSPVAAVAPPTPKPPKSKEAPQKLSLVRGSSKPDEKQKIIIEPGVAFNQAESVHQAIDMAREFGDQADGVFEVYVASSTPQKLNQRNVEEQTPLQYALSIDAPRKIIDALLKDDRVVVDSRRDSKGNSALYYAIFNGVQRTKGGNTFSTEDHNLAKRIYDMCRNLDQGTAAYLDILYRDNRKKYHKLAFALDLPAANAAEAQEKTSD